MLGSLMEWVQSWLPWFGLGGAGVLGAAWFFGLMPVLGAAAQIVASVLAPILGAVVQGFVWMCANVFLPGLKDVLDDWVTIVTVAVAGTFLWFGAIAHGEMRVIKSQRETYVCQAELKKSRGNARQVEEPKFELPWPFTW